MRRGYNPALEELHRRADPLARVIPELAATSSEDVRDRPEEWATLDSTAGIELLPEGGIRLAGDPEGVIGWSESNGYMESLRRDHPSSMAMLRWLDGPSDDTVDSIVIHLIPQLDPGEDLEVAQWGIQLLAVLTHNEADDGSLTDGSEPPLQYSVAPLHEPIYVPAAGGPVGADVEIDFRTRGLIVTPSRWLPRYLGATPEYAIPQPPITLVHVWASRADGTPAGNVGWGADGGSLTDNGVTLLGFASASGSDHLEMGGEYMLTTVPRMSVYRRSYVTSTATFGAASPIQVELTTEDADVELVGEGEEPEGTALVYEVQADDGTWVEYQDGDLAAIDNRAQGGTDLSATAAHPVGRRAEYAMRVVLLPSEAGTRTPVVRSIGARAIERTLLDGVASFAASGRWAVDPVELRGEVMEGTLDVLRTGERDYRDPASDLFSRYSAGQMTVRLWLGHPTLARSNWMLLDVFLVDDWESAGPALRVLCISPLAYTRTRIPAPLPGSDDQVHRSPVTFANAPLPAIYDVLLRAQLAVPERYRGPGIPDTVTWTASKRIEDSEGKEELDAIARLAGGAAIASQGRITWVDMLGPKPLTAIFRAEEIAVTRVTPGLRLRQPEFFVPWQYREDADGDGGRFLSEFRGINLAAIEHLGTASLDAPKRLTDVVAKWIDTEALAEETARATTEIVGAGVPMIDVESVYPYPELEPGDLVAVQTDALVLRDFGGDRSLAGPLWAVGPIQSVANLEGTSFCVWVRRYSDLFPGTEPIERQGYRRDAQLLDFRVVEDAPGALTFAWERDGADYVFAARLDFDDVPEDPWDAVRQAVEELPGTQNTYVVPVPVERRDTYVQVEARWYDVSTGELVPSQVWRAVIPGTIAPLTCTVVPVYSIGEVSLEVTVDDPRGVLDVVRYYVVTRGDRTGPLTATDVDGDVWTYTASLDPKHPIGIQPELVRTDGQPNLWGETYTSDVDHVPHVADVRVSRSGSNYTIYVDGDDDCAGGLYYRERVDGVLGDEIAIPARALDPRFGVIVVAGVPGGHSLELYGKTGDGASGVMVPLLLDPYLPPPQLLQASVSVIDLGEGNAVEYSSTWEVSAGVTDAGHGIEISYYQGSELRAHLTHTTPTDGVHLYSDEVAGDGVADLHHASYTLFDKTSGGTISVLTTRSLPSAV